MMISLFRFGRVAVIGGLIFAFGPGARAQQKAAIPAFTGERVIVVGACPIGMLRSPAQITRLEKASPQSYYVVVVNSSGTGESATREYADQLFESWRKQGSRRGPSFDAERSVIVVVALENHQVAVKPGTYLVNRLGLHGDRVERDLIPVFLPLAHESRYTEAIASLLDATNNWIAARDSETPYVAVQVPASKVGRSGTGDSEALQKQHRLYRPRLRRAPMSSREGPSRDIASTSPAPPVPVKSSSSEWLPVVIVAVPIGLMVVAFVGWIWHLYRRAQGRVAGRIKEIKSNAADVMDRLDGLKERLKLMPTSTEFKQPMTGETQALYQAVNEKLGKLWDGWLHVMDVLEKAQKLAARSGSPLVAKDAGRGRGVDGQTGLVRGDRSPGPGDRRRCRPARACPRGGAHDARGGDRGPAQDRCRARRDQEAWACRRRPTRKSWGLSPRD